MQVNNFKNEDHLANSYEKERFVSPIKPDHKNEDSDERNSWQLGQSVTKELFIDTRERFRRDGKPQSDGCRMKLRQGVQAKTRLHSALYEN